MCRHRGPTLNTGVTKVCSHGLQNKTANMYNYISTILLPERENALLSLMAARLEAQGIRDRSTVLQGDLSRTLAHAFLRCCIEGWRPQRPDDIPLHHSSYTDEEGRHSESVLEEPEDRSKVRDRMVECHVTPDDAEAIVDCCLTWNPDADAMIALPTTDSTNRNEAQPLREVDVILGFAFGNRFVADRWGRRNGNRDPGPINAMLAELVVKYYQASLALRGGLSPPEIWVQWEIADRIGGQIPSRVVCPEIDTEKDQVSYASTSDVVLAIGPERLRDQRKVLVVAHPDHLLRCMWIVAKGRSRYYCKGEHRLPYGVRHHDSGTSRDDGWYDPASGQFWTARRHRCLIHEAIGRLNIYQNEGFSQTADHLAAYRQTLNRKEDDELVWQPGKRN
jgi:hypothetical protein